MKLNELDSFLGGAVRKCIHFVGIGGAGMSPLASLLKRSGHRVSGSDLVLTPVTDNLAKEGIAVHEGHCRSHVTRADLVVITSAVGCENPEVSYALDRDIPVVSRALLLGTLMKPYKGIGFAGTHGKTSSTSICALLFESLGLDPTVVVGGRPAGWKSNLRTGDSEYFLVEADESDGSFLNLPCSIVQVTNIDDDHLEFYDSMEKLTSYFLRFIQMIGPHGMAFLCADDKNLKSLMSEILVPFQTYGQSADCDYVVSQIQVRRFQTSFSITFPGGRKVDNFVINAPGLHYALNSAGCCAIAHSLGCDEMLIRDGLKKYKGVGRRFEYIGEKGGITIVDDYGHHPTEIEAVLTSLKSSGNFSVAVAFQPHRASRTLRLAQRLGAALSIADTVFLLPVYEPAGGEAPDEDPSGLIYEYMASRKTSNVQFLKDHSLREAAAAISSQLTPGVIFITLGAGTVTGLGPMVLEDI